MKKQMKKYWKKVARLRKENYEYALTRWTTFTYPFFEVVKTRRWKLKKDKTIYIY